MDAQGEKIYVAIGNDLQDGFKTLEWTLGKWNSRSISIVILHLTYNVNSADFVYTPFGKLPASAVSEEKLQVLRKYEQEKTDKLLSKYITFCGKVKAEILKVEKQDEPVQKLIVDLISRLQINKLVMGFTFMKSSSWKAKGTISGSYYIHQHKPHFCEFYIICGGKQVFLGRDNKVSLKKWVGKMFSDQTNTPESNSRHSSSSSSVNSNSPKSQNQWEIHVQEIESYLQQLLSSDLDADHDLPQENDSFQIITSHAAESENNDSHMSLAEKIESLRSKINEAHKEIELKRKQAKENVERHAKAGWVISLCIQRAEELETSIKEEVKNRSELEKELDAEKEQMNEVIIDIEESKSRLRSLLELQTELSEKLQISTMTKTQAEVQLEKAVLTRAEMVRDIEELRRQRDVFNRRIEFCREKDAIGMLSKLNEVRCGYREYSAEEMRLATDNFSESKRLKSGGDWTNVYRGRVKHGAVAIKVLTSIGQLSKEAFQAKVDEVGQIRHPHLVAMVGFCSDLNCIVFEYMHNGSLRDVSSSSNRGSRKRNQALHWLDRVRIAAHVCSGLGFLHMAKPVPMVHGCLASSNILLDRNHVAKIGGYGLSQAHDERGVRLDIRAFGSVMLHLLTGREWAGLVEEAMIRDRAALAQVLDEAAGDWPLDLAEEFAGLAVRCLSINSEPNADLSITRIMEELSKIKNKAEDAMKTGGESDAFIKGDVDEADSCDVPKNFICPIFQDIMKNPHVAADGFSYELEAIEEWVETGHDISPITNLRFNHTKVTPNHTLRLLIQDWQSKRSTAASLAH